MHTKRKHTQKTTPKKNRLENEHWWSSAGAFRRETGRRGTKKESKKEGPRTPSSLVVTAAGNISTFYPPRHCLHQKRAQWKQQQSAHFHDHHTEEGKREGGSLLRLGNFDRSPLPKSDAARCVEGGGGQKRQPAPVRRTVQTREGRGRISIGAATAHPAFSVP